MLIISRYYFYSSYNFDSIAAPVFIRLQSSNLNCFAVMKSATRCIPCVVDNIMIKIFKSKTKNESQHIIFEKIYETTIGMIVHSSISLGI